MVMEIKMSKKTTKTKKTTKSKTSSVLEQELATTI